MAQVGTRPTSTDATETTPEGQKEIVGRSPSEIFWRRFRQDKFALAGLAFIILLIIIAFVAPLIAQYVAHHDRNQLFVFQQLDDFGLPKGPSKAFWFGADSAGRDLFVRTLYGARTSSSLPSSPPESSS